MLRRQYRNILLTLIVLSITLLYVSNISWLFNFSLPIKNIDLEDVPIVPIAPISAIIPIVKTLDTAAGSDNNKNTILSQTIQTLPSESLPKTEVFNFKNSSIYLTNAQISSKLNAEKVDSYLDDVKEVVDYDEISKDEAEFTSKSTVQRMILSYWSSGASFLSEVLNSIPETHYNFEPLMYFGMKKIRTSSDVTQALNTIRQMLQCNYMGLDDYFHFENYEFVARRNTLFWNSCQFNTSYCSSPTFVSAFCQMMPYRITQEVRLLAEHSELLLADPDLNVKIVLLIRDPRGIMHSRNQKKWCNGYPDCENVSNLCNDMVADFKAAEMLTKKYPDQFAVLRYEDLSMDLFNITEKILKFYELPFHDDVKKFLASHTRANKKGAISIFQDSEMAPFRWIREMRISEVQSIQSECGEAMSLWGYEHVTEEDILEGGDYEPLLTSSEAIKDGEQEISADIKITVDTLNESRSPVSLKSYISTDHVNESSDKKLGGDI